MQKFADGQSECQTIWITDEDPHFVGLHLDPNCLHRSSTVFKKFTASGLRVKLGKNEWFTLPSGIESRLDSCFLRKVPVWIHCPFLLLCFGSSPVFCLCLGWMRATKAITLAWAYIVGFSWLAYIYNITQLLHSWRWTLFWLYIKPFYSNVTKRLLFFLLCLLRFIF